MKVSYEEAEIKKVLPLTALYSRMNRVMGLSPSNPGAQTRENVLSLTPVNVTTGASGSTERRSRRNKDLIKTTDFTSAKPEDEGAQPDPRSSWWSCRCPPTLWQQSQALQSALFPGGDVWFCGPTREQQWTMCGLTTWRKTNTALELMKGTGSFCHVCTLTLVQGGAERRRGSGSDPCVCLCLDQHAVLGGGLEVAQKDALHLPGGTHAQALPPSKLFVRGVVLPVADGVAAKEPVCELGLGGLMRGEVTL